MTPERVHELNKLGGYRHVLDIVRRVVAKPSTNLDVGSKEKYPDPLHSGHRMELRLHGKLELTLRHFQLKYQREVSGELNPTPWSIDMHGIYPDKEMETLTALRQRFSESGIVMVPLYKDGSFSLVHVSTVQSQEDLSTGQQ